MLKTVVTLAALAVLAVVVYDFVRSYMKATSAGWQRVWDAGKGSATIVWQQLGLVVAAIVTASTTAVDWVCQLVNDPGAADPIKQIITAYVTPVNVGVALAVFSVVGIIARLRTMRKPAAS